MGEIGPLCQPLLAFGGFSPFHWLLVGVVALLLFGNRLPEVARSLGRSFKEFKRGLHDVTDEMDRSGDSKAERLDAPQERERLADESTSKATDGPTRAERHDQAD